jgi:hypothetical protein
VPLPPSPPPPPPRLLQLPVDIVLYLCREHLPPAAAAALSLTCRDLFALVFPGARPGLATNASERQDLLLLLESDLAHGWWYCHCCSWLRRVSTLGPSARGRDCTAGFRCDDYHHNRRWFAGSSYSIDYQSARLAMNRHFFGPPKGLPLDRFDLEAGAYTAILHEKVHLPWRDKWSARILQDELFLSATRTASGAGWTDDALRAALEDEWRDICGHVRTSSDPNFLAVNVLSRLSVTPTGFFAPCRGTVEACSRCFTDYTITIERKVEDAEEGRGKREPAGFWFITITSYHQLGCYRSPLDPKWDGFGMPMRQEAFAERRDMEAYPTGIIKAMWDSYDSTQ